LGFEIIKAGEEIKAKHRKRGRRYKGGWELIIIN